LKVAYWVIAGLLAAVYAFSGVKKLVQSQDQLRPMMGWVDTMPVSRIRIIGLLEVLGTVGVIAPPLSGIAPGVAVAAAIGLALIQIGAFRLHLSRHELANLPLNAALLVLSGAAAWLGAALWT
jgi:uncharacterized membrane protein